MYEPQEYDGRYLQIDRCRNGMRQKLFQARLDDVEAFALAAESGQNALSRKPEGGRSALELSLELDVVSQKVSFYCAVGDGDRGRLPVGTEAAFLYPEEAPVWICFTAPRIGLFARGIKYEGPDCGSAIFEKFVYEPMDICMNKLEKSGRLNAVMSESNNRAAHSPIKLLCVGLGGHWVDMWASRPEARFVAFVDYYGEKERADGASAMAYAAENGVPVYDSLDEALAGGPYDVVTAVTPNYRKTEVVLAEKVLSAGYDLLLEKLRPTTPSDWRKLLELSRSTGRQVGIGEPYRYEPHSAAARLLIEEGALGDIGHVEWRCHQANIDAAWMHAYTHVMLEDLSYHHFGLLHYLLGVDKLDRLFAVSRLPAWAKVPSPSIVTLSADSADGSLHLSYHASWNAHGGFTSWLGDYRIVGTKGQVEFKDGALTFIDAEGRQRKVDPVDPFPYAQRAGVAEEYIRSRLEGRRTVFDIGEFYPVLRMIEAALESNGRGEAVKL